MILELNKEDLKGGFMDGKDCPIFRALKRQGYKVNHVGAWEVTIDYISYRLLRGDGTYIIAAQNSKLDRLEVEIEGL